MKRILQYGVILLLGMLSSAVWALTPAAAGDYNSACLSSGTANHGLFDYFDTIPSGFTQSNPERDDFYFQCQCTNHRTGQSDCAGGTVYGPDVPGEFYVSDDRDFHASLANDATFASCQAACSSDGQCCAVMKEQVYDGGACLNKKRPCKNVGGLGAGTDSQTKQPLYRYYCEPVESCVPIMLDDMSCPVCYEPVSGEHQLNQHPNYMGQLPIKGCTYNGALPADPGDPGGPTCNDMTLPTLDDMTPPDLPEPSDQMLSDGDNAITDVRNDDLEKWGGHWRGGCGAGEFGDSIFDIWISKTGCYNPEERFTTLIPDPVTGVDRRVPDDEVLLLNWRCLPDKGEAYAVAGAATLYTRGALDKLSVADVLTKEGETFYQCLHNDLIDDMDDVCAGYFSEEYGKYASKKYILNEKKQCYYKQDFPDFLEINRNDSYLPLALMKQEYNHPVLWPDYVGNHFVMADKFLEDNPTASTYYLGEYGFLNQSIHKDQWITGDEQYIPRPPPPPGVDLDDYLDNDPGAFERVLDGWKTKRSGAQSGSARVPLPGNISTDNSTPEYPAQTPYDPYDTYGAITGQLDAFEKKAEKRLEKYMEDPDNPVLSTTEQADLLARYIEQEIDSFTTQVDHVGVKEKRRKCIKSYIEGYAHRADCGEIILSGAKPELGLSHCYWGAQYASYSGRSAAKAMSFNNKSNDYDTIQRPMRSEATDWMRMQLAGWDSAKGMSDTDKLTSTDVCKKSLARGDSSRANDGVLGSALFAGGVPRIGGDKSPGGKLDFSQRGCPMVISQSKWPEEFDRQDKHDPLYDEAARFGCDEHYGHKPINSLTYGAKNTSVWFGNNASFNMDSLMGGGFQTVIDGMIGPVLGAGSSALESIIGVNVDFSNGVHWLTTDVNDTRSKFTFIPKLPTFRALEYALLRDDSGDQAEERAKVTRWYTYPYERYEFKELAEHTLTDGWILKAGGPGGKAAIYPEISLDYKFGSSSLFSVPLPFVPPGDGALTIDYKNRTGFPVMFATLFESFAAGGFHFDFNTFKNALVGGQTDWADASWPARDCFHYSTPYLIYKDAHGQRADVDLRELAGDMVEGMSQLVKKMKELKDNNILSQARDGDEEGQGFMAKIIGVAGQVIGFLPQEGEGGKFLGFEFDYYPPYDEKYQDNQRIGYIYTIIPNFFVLSLDAVAYFADVLQKNLIFSRPIFCDFELPFNPFLEGRDNERAVSPLLPPYMEPVKHVKQNSAKTVKNKPVLLNYYRVERIRNGCGAFNHRGTWQRDGKYAPDEWEHKTNADGELLYYEDDSKRKTTTNNTGPKLRVWKVKSWKWQNNSLSRFLVDQDSRCENWQGMYERKVTNPKIINWRLPRFDYEFLRSFIECTGPFKQAHDKKDLSEVPRACQPENFGGSIKDQINSKIGPYFDQFSSALDMANKMFPDEQDAFFIHPDYDSDPNSTVDDDPGNFIFFSQRGAQLYQRKVALEDILFPLMNAGDVIGGPPLQNVNILTEYPKIPVLLEQNETLEVTEIWEVTTPVAVSFYFDPATSASNNLGPQPYDVERITYISPTGDITKNTTSGVQLLPISLFKKDPSGAFIRDSNDNKLLNPVVLYDKFGREFTAESIFSTDSMKKRAKKRVGKFMDKLMSAISSFSGGDDEFSSNYADGTCIAVHAVEFLAKLVKCIFSGNCDYKGMAFHLVIGDDCTKPEGIAPFWLKENHEPGGEPKCVETLKDANGNDIIEDGKTVCDPNAKFGFWCNCPKDRWATTACREDFCTCEQQVVVTGAFVFQPVTFCKGYGPYKKWLQCYYQARAKSCPILTRDVSNNIAPAFTLANQPTANEPPPPAEMCEGVDEETYGREDVINLRWYAEEPNHLSHLPVRYESGSGQGHKHEDLVFMSQTRDIEPPYMEPMIPLPASKLQSYDAIVDGSGNELVPAHEAPEYTRNSSNPDGHLVQDKYFNFKLNVTDYNGRNIYMPESIERSTFIPKSHLYSGPATKYKDYVLFEKSKEAIRRAFIQTERPDYDIGVPNVDDYVSPRAQSAVVGPRGCDIGGWYEMMMYQARCVKWLRLNCLCDYDKTFIVGSDESWGLKRGGNIFNTKRLQYGAADEDISWSIVSETEIFPLRWRGDAGPNFGLKIQTDATTGDIVFDPPTGNIQWETYAGDLGARLWDKTGTHANEPKWRDGDTYRNNLAAGANPDPQVMPIYGGLSDARPGDIIIFDETMDMSKHKYRRHMAYVTFHFKGEEPVADFDGAADTEFEEKTEYIEVSEYNWGKNQDSCGNTDRWHVRTQRRIYNPHYPNGYPPDGSVAENCLDPDRMRCVEPNWDRVKVYRPAYDLSQMCPESDPDFPELITKDWLGEKVASGAMPAEEEYTAYSADKTKRSFDLYVRDATLPEVESMTTGLPLSAADLQKFFKGFRYDADRNFTYGGWRHETRGLGSYFIHAQVARFMAKHAGKCDIHYKKDLVPICVIDVDPAVHADSTIAVGDGCGDGGQDGTGMSQMGNTSDIWETSTIIGFIDQHPNNMDDASGNDIPTIGGGFKLMAGGERIEAKTYVNATTGRVEQGGTVNQTDCVQNGGIWGRSGTYYLDVHQFKRANSPTCFVAATEVQF